MKSFAAYRLFKGIIMIQLPDHIHHTRFALVIRHGERERIVETARALEALLTEKGKQEAVELGKSLAPSGNIIIHHSPVERCRQTAEKIYEGIIAYGGSARIAGPLMELGGPYIAGSWGDIIAEIERRGFNGFVRAWFNGQLPKSLITPLEDSAKLQASILRSQLEKNDASYVNVSHDWNVMCLREYYFGIRHEDAGTPAYLDGLIALPSSNGTILHHNGTERAID